MSKSLGPILIESKFNKDLSNYIHHTKDSISFETIGYSKRVSSSIIKKLDSVVLYDKSFFIEAKYIDDNRVKIVLDRKQSYDLKLGN